MVPWLHQWCNKRRNWDVRHTRLRSETQSCVNLFALTVLMMTWYARSEHLWKLLTSDQVLVAWPKAIRTKADFKANGSASKKLFHLPSLVKREVRQLYKYIGEQNAVKTSIDHNHPIMCSILFHIYLTILNQTSLFLPTNPFFGGQRGSTPPQGVGTSGPGSGWSWSPATTSIGRWRASGPPWPWRRTARPRLGGRERPWRWKKPMGFPHLPGTLCFLLAVVQEGWSWWIMKSELIMANG